MRVRKVRVRLSPDQDSGQGPGLNHLIYVLLRLQNSKVIASSFELDINASQACYQQVIIKHRNTSDSNIQRGEGGQLIIELKHKTYRAWVCAKLWQASFFSCSWLGRRVGLYQPSMSGRLFPSRTFNHVKNSKFTFNKLAHLVELSMRWLGRDTWDKFLWGMLTLSVLFWAALSSRMFWTA